MVCSAPGSSGLATVMGATVSFPLPADGSRPDEQYRSTGDRISHAPPPRISGRYMPWDTPSRLELSLVEPAPLSPARSASIARESSPCFQIVIARNAAEAC